MKVFKKLFVLLILITTLTGLIGCQGNNVSKENQEKINKIDAILNDIIDNHATKYLNVNEGNLFVDYDFVAAMNLLNKNKFKVDITKVLSKEEVTKHITDEMTFDNIGNALRMLILTRAYNIKRPQSINQYTEKLETSGGSFSIPTELILLQETKNNQKVQEEALNAISTVHETDYFSADTAGFILAVSSQYDVDTTNLINFIKQKTLEDGVSGWDDLAASESTSLSMIGLIAVGQKIEYSLNDNKSVNLYNQLINFYLKAEKGFKSRLTHESADLRFATPQAFAALAVYRTYLLTGKKVNLYY